jgi:predicted nucleotidyltransferase
VAEKSLKAVLEHLASPAHGHDLLELLKEVSGIVGVPEELRGACRILNRHYIPTRYPNAFSSGTPIDMFDEKDADEALKLAEEVLKFAGKVTGFTKFDSLKKFLGRISMREGLKSVVLFGSMARGDYTKFSDYDLLIIVESDERRFIDRLLEYYGYSEGSVEPFVYTKDEVGKMFEEFNPLILDALKEGIALIDDGLWSSLKERFSELLWKGVLKPKPKGWRIDLTKGEGEGQRGSAPRATKG